MSSTAQGRDLEIRSGVLARGDHFVRAANCHDAPDADHTDEVTEAAPAEDEVTEAAPAEDDAPVGTPVDAPTAASVRVHLTSDRPDTYARVEIDEDDLDGRTIARLRQAAQVLLRVADDLEGGLVPRRAAESRPHTPKAASDDVEDGL